MAKSIRSKRKRMLRNIKRERYAKKDLEKLKEMVALAEKDKDTEMKELYTGKRSVDGEHTVVIQRKMFSACPSIIIYLF